MEVTVAGVQRILCVIVALLSIACAPTDFTYRAMSPDGKQVTVVPVYVDERWNDTERFALHAAMEEWNVALGGHLTLKVVNDAYHVGTDVGKDPGYVFIKTDSRDPLIDQQEQFISFAWTHGRGSGVGGNRIYFIMDRFPTWNLLAIARHEIGHMLGSPHIEHNGLMSPRFNPMFYNCIDRDVVLVVAKYRNLSVDGMSWCEKH